MSDNVVFAFDYTEPDRAQAKRYLDNTKQQGGFSFAAGAYNEILHAYGGKKMSYYDLS
jgi:hypothetical protein